MSGDDTREPGASTDSSGEATPGSPAGDPESASLPAAPASGDESGAWWVYRGTGVPVDTPLERTLPPPPPWRDFDGGPVATDPPPDDEAEVRRRLGAPGTAVRPTSAEELDLINAALFLRRPLIVTGPPGIGKSSLAHLVSRELGLGRVLRWTITSRSTLTEGLYTYDAVGRVQDAAARAALDGRTLGALRLSGGVPGDTPGDDGAEGDATGDGGPGAPLSGEGHDLSRGIGDFLQLGPLGTALIPRATPRVLLVDEFDKADSDLANDLLGVFEDGEFRIPELSRVRARTPDVEVHTDDPDRTATVHHGRVRCRAFPFVVITSNGERALPPAFLRRCLRLEMTAPDEGRLAAMLAAQFTVGDDAERATMIRDFLARSQVGGTLAADQLLNSEYLRTAPSGPDPASWNRLLHSLWRRLDEVGPG